MGCNKIERRRNNYRRSSKSEKKNKKEKGKKGEEIRKRGTEKSETLRSVLLMKERLDI